jgi:S-adenosylmethionine:tRNA ribosyltransferase-isomerase
MHISEFEYHLPVELIAQEPLAQRSASRMLVLDRKRGCWSDSQFNALVDYLLPQDVLVFNNTRVFPARLRGQRNPSGGKVEVLLVRQIEPLVWEAMVRPAGRLKIGARIRFGDGLLSAEVLDSTTGGARVLRFDCPGSLDQILDEIGELPLPPYIKRPAGTTQNDRERYQTVYARVRGAIAAPTAGLHFTDSDLYELRQRGVKTAELTLHVGYGTFEPVRVENVEEHQVAGERLQIRSDAAATINAAHSQAGRIIAIGTTTTRALESSVNEAGQVEAGSRSTALTVIPGYKFRAVDALITNFHLPRSSLLLLVCAFAGSELVLEAYRHAVAMKYRFYSYGDCMLII